MNKKFDEYVTKTVSLYQDLMAAEIMPIKPQSTWKGIKAIYIFWDDNKAVHVGRTRNLQGRVRGHISNSHYSASFVFKQTRLATGIKATYKPETSRATLFADKEFRRAFDLQMELHKKRTMSYLEVPNPIDQYLLELYTALELNLPLDEFDTH